MFRLYHVAAGASEACRHTGQLVVFEDFGNIAVEAVAVVVRSYNRVACQGLAGGAFLPVVVASY